MAEEIRFRIYFVATLLSITFAVLGLTYNTWRQELSEDNTNIRTASFTVLIELAELEQLIYVLHYDQDESEGSPRKGWVKIGLITDLSILISKPVYEKSLLLKDSWQGNWKNIMRDRRAVNKLVESIETIRSEIKVTLYELD